METEIQEMLDLGHGTVSFSIFFSNSIGSQKRWVGAVLHRFSETE